MFSFNIFAISDRSLWKAAQTAGPMPLLPQWHWETRCVIAPKPWTSRKLKGWPRWLAPTRAYVSPRLSVKGSLRPWPSQLLQHFIYKLCLGPGANAASPFWAPWCPLNMGFHSRWKALAGSGERGYQPNLLSNISATKSQKVKRRGPSYSSTRSFVFKNEEGLAGSGDLRINWKSEQGLPTQDLPIALCDQGPMDPK